jgi:uncharacterized protein YjbJ (UPF0337 family)
VDSEGSVNWDRAEGSWRLWKGKLMVRWGRLTNDPFDVIAGRRHQRFGRVQLRHGIAREEAERRVPEIAGPLGDSAQGD